MFLLNTLLVLAPLLPSATAYGLAAQYDSSNFFDSNSFQWIDSWDMYTQGFAQYVPMASAQAGGFARTTKDNKVFLGVDNTTTLTSTKVGKGNGRKSIRLESTKTFDNGLFIADFDHMPANACGMWPAFWLLHDDGDGYSEIDIVENISKQLDDEVSLYTDQQCSMTDNGSTGTVRDTDVNLDAGGGGVNAADGTFGAGFNVKGGYWVTQVETDGIKVWYFAHGNAPADIGSDNPNPTAWKKPFLNFSPGGCDMAKAFKKMKIIFNISFCGSYAGSSTWGTYTGCQASTRINTCESYIASKPADLKDVYFLINSVKVFQSNIKPSSTPTPTFSKTSSTFGTKSTSTFTSRISSMTTSAKTSSKVSSTTKPTSTIRPKRRSVCAFPTTEPDTDAENDFTSDSSDGSDGSDGSHSLDTTVTSDGTDGRDSTDGSDGSDDSTESNNTDGSDGSDDSDN